MIIDLETMRKLICDIGPIVSFEYQVFFIWLVGVFVWRATNNFKAAWRLTSDYGFSIGLGYLVFISLGSTTGWRIGHFFMRDLPKRLGLPKGMCAWAYDDKLRKTTPRAQDIRVFLGVIATALAVVGLTGQFEPIWQRAAFLVATWHLLGIFLYNTTVLLFDDFRPEVDPRVWNFRRVFLQALINLAESWFIFAGLYNWLSDTPNVPFWRTLMWSVQGLTLNIPREWQESSAKSLYSQAGLSYQEWIWIAQVVVTILFIVVVLGQVGSVMYKREEINTPNRKRISTRAGEGGE